MTDTPYLTVDVAQLDRNIVGLADSMAPLGIAVRPHAKTHKCAQIARRQLEAGAVGLTVATIGEAEAFVDAMAFGGSGRGGEADLFIAYPLWLTESAATRVRRLAERVSLRIGVDSIAGVRQWATVFGSRIPPIEVVIEVDSGQHRTGVVPAGAGAVASAAADVGLDVVGVFTFPGHGYGLGESRRRAAEEESAALSVAAETLRDRNIEPRVRSGGATPTIGFVGGGVLTEIRPGVYPFNDAQQVTMGSCDLGAVALWATSTVVHRTGTRIALDAGSKILGADRPAWLDGFGLLPDFPDAQIVSLSEHHAVVDFPDTTSLSDVPVPGSVVRVVPNHVCTAVNLVDELVAHHPDGTEDRWPVIARGRNS